MLFIFSPVNEKLGNMLLSIDIHDNRSISLQNTAFNNFKTHPGKIIFIVRHR